MRRLALALAAAVLAPAHALADAGEPSHANDFFGGAIDLDGDRLAVGVVGSNADGLDAGLVHVYSYERGEWRLTAQLANPADSPAHGAFGRALALAGDSLAVAATIADTRGVVHVFTRQGDAWSEQARLDDPNTDHDDFGRALALAGDTLAVVATGRVRDRGELPPRATIFRRDGDQWREQARLDLPALGLRGLALGDGTLLLGLGGDPAVLAYRRDGDQWRPDPSLAIAPRTLESLAVDGDTAIVLVDGDDPRALVFRDAGDAWSLEQELDYARDIPSSPSPYALDLDGDRAAVSFYFHLEDAGERTRVALWSRAGGDWQHAGDLDVPPAEAKTPDNFGTTLAVGARWLAVGAPRSGEARHDQSGLVYIYATGGLSEVALLGPGDALGGCGCRGGGPGGLLVGLLALVRRRRRSR